MGRLELTIDVIQRSFGAVVRDRGPALAPAHHALQPQRAHQTLDRAASNHDLLATELPPHLAYAIDAEVLLVHAANLRQ
jgi:hypothetical protein